MVALERKEQERATGEPEGADRLKLHTPLLGDDVEGAGDGFLNGDGPAGAEGVLVFEEAGDLGGGKVAEGGGADAAGGGVVAAQRRLRGVAGMALPWCERGASVVRRQ